MIDGPNIIFTMKNSSQETITHCWVIFIFEIFMKVRDGNNCLPGCPAPRPIANNKTCVSFCPKPLVSNDGECVKSCPHFKTDVAGLCCPDTRSLGKCR